MVDKIYLRMHAEHRSELEAEIRRHELIYGTSPYRSPSNTDEMPHASGGINDTTANAVIKKLDPSSYIGRLDKIVQDEEREIEAVLALLPKADQKTVIRIKYYHRYDWDDVAMFIYGDKVDYVGNSEKYKVKAQKLHGAALANMKNVQEVK